MIQKKTNEIRIAFFARIILVLGGLNYLYMASVSKNEFLFIPFPKNVLNLLFIIIGLSALYLFFNRDYYLPFLGETVIPTISPLKKNKKDLITTIIKNLPPKSTVIYWAAKSSEKDLSLILDPYKAYGDYENSGVTVSNELGEAQIEYECPTTYQVSKFGIFKKVLRRHIHFRYTDSRLPGFISPVKTLFLDVDCK